MLFGAFMLPSSPPAMPFQLYIFTVLWNPSPLFRFNKWGTLKLSYAWLLGRPNWLTKRCGWFASKHTATALCVHVYMCVCFAFLRPLVISYCCHISVAHLQPFKLITPHTHAYTYKHIHTLLYVCICILLCIKVQCMLCCCQVVSWAQIARLHHHHHAGPIIPIGVNVS